MDARANGKSDGMLDNKILVHWIALRQGVTFILDLPSRRINNDKQEQKAQNDNEDIRYIVSLSEFLFEMAPT